jgi:hypothetical protein
MLLAADGAVGRAAWIRSHTQRAFPIAIISGL